MPQTTQGLTYPDSSGHTRLWEHLQQLAEDVDDLIGLNRTQSGVSSIPFDNDATQYVNVVFPEAFSDVPNVTCSAQNVGINVSAHNITATGFTLYGRRLEGATQGTPVNAQWIAHGPR